MWSEVLEADIFLGKIAIVSFLTKKDGFGQLLKVDSVLSPNDPFPSLILCRDDVC